MKKLLYIDCKHSGIAGDMFLAALYGLNDDETILTQIQSYVNEKIFDAKLSTIGIQKISRNGMFPHKLVIVFDEKHPEMHVPEIQEHIPKLCDILKLSSEAKEFANHWFSILLEAERSVHSISDSNHLHLHELGSIDTLIDICGGTAYLDALNVFSKKDAVKIYCSTVAVGGGLVKIAHGTVPVPAPATMEIIKKYSIPICGGPIDKELFTPTGAGLIGALTKLKSLHFSDLPPMKIKTIGMSTGNLGNVDFPNILRVLLGTDTTFMNGIKKEVVVLETMVDDCSGETLGIVMDYLFQEGALDVNYISVQGKKNRPGILLRILTSKSNIDAIMSVLFTQLGTLGVRYRVENRVCLKREIIEKTTEIDNVSVTYHVKIAYNPSDPSEILFHKVEHDDIVKISKELDKPLSIIRAILESKLEILK
ncbi:MAG: nickel pincer cofactor biosynthesis protein LarC [Promethearchaeota archaeon]